MFGVPEGEALCKARVFVVFPFSSGAVAQHCGYGLFYVALLRDVESLGFIISEEVLRTLGKFLLSDPIPHRPLSSPLPEASFLEESAPVTPMSYSHTTVSR